MGPVPTLSRMQEVLDVSNAVAAELASMGDGVLDALRDRLGCTIRLRGNQLTLDGDDPQVAEARGVIAELVELIEDGHQVGAQTVDAVLGALEADQDVRQVFDDVVWRHRGKLISPKTVMQKAYVDAIRRCTMITFGIGPAGTGKTYLAMALAVAALQEKQVARIILTPAGGRGRRAARVPARRHAGEGRPLPAPAVRRALRHARPRTGEHLHGAGHDRGGAARIHARAGAATFGLRVDTGGIPADRNPSRR